MLQILLVCLLALSATQANTINQYGFRTLSGYGSQAPNSLGGGRLGSSSAFLSKPAIIAAPVNNGYGQQQAQQRVLQQAQVAQPSSGYGQQQQQQAAVAQQAQVVQPSSGYGQQQEQVQQAQVVQPSSGYGQQQLPIAQEEQVQVLQPSSGYGQQQQQQQQAAVAQQAQVVQPYSGYGQQQQAAVAQQNLGHDDSYGQHAAPMSPMALFMAQPAIQQLISTMVQQYHGNNLGSTPEVQNTCSVGFTQPIYEQNQVTETYCRCPTGTYGFTCTENFVNPCTDGSIEFTAADNRVPATYFIKCSWGIPYLNKCPAGTIRWAQELQACIAEEPVQVVPQAPLSSYGNYNQAPKTILRSNGY